MSLLLTDVQVLFSGPTAVQRALLALPLLAIGLALFALLRLARADGEREDRGRRCSAAVIAIATLAFSGLLGIWNLIGWQI